MSQGSRSNSQVINLDDDLIEKRLTRPAKVFLAGREWSVRRDLTAEEIYDFWGKVTKNDDSALTLLVGEAGAELNKTLQQLPAAMYVRKLHQLMNVAGLKRGDEPEDTTGESMPS